MESTEELTTETINDIDGSVIKSLKKRGYKILDKIGSGSYGKVYQCWYRPQGSNHEVKLACKIIDVKKVAVDYSTKFLPREMEILCKVSHTSICGAHSVYSKDEMYFVFMNYAENGDLLTFVQEHGPLEEELTFKWFHQIVGAVHYLHFHKICHRDLKCENVLISKQFNMKVSDFGFARFVERQDDMGMLSTTFCGSVSYTAPEILSGKPYDPYMVDIWSLGVILYVMFNKSMPFCETNIKKLVETQLAQDWHFRKTVSRKLSSEAKQLVQQLLDPDPSERPNSFQTLESPWFKSTLEDYVMTVYDPEEPDSGVSPYHWVPFTLRQTGAESDTTDTEETREPFMYLTRAPKRANLLARTKM